MLRIYTTLFIVMIFWGFNVAATKTLVSTISPLMLTAIRIGTAGFTVLVISYFLNIFRLPSRRQWLFIFYIMSFNVIGHHAFLATGLTKTSGVHAGLILGSSPLVVMLFSIIFLKVLPSRLQFLGFVFGFLGIFITTLANPDGFSQLSIGDLFILLSMVTQAYSFILIARTNIELDPRLLTGYMLIIGAFLIFIIGFFTEGDISQYEKLLNWKLFSIFIFSAIFCTAIGHMIYNDAIKKVGPAESAIFINLNTAFALIGSYLFLKEEILLAHFIGMIFIFIGVFLGSGTFEYLYLKYKKKRSF